MRRCGVKNYSIERTVIRATEERGKTVEGKEKRGMVREKYPDSLFNRRRMLRVELKGEQIKIYRLYEADILTAINILNPGAAGQNIGLRRLGLVPCWGRH